MDVTIAAYIAGLIDGEGSIMLNVAATHFQPSIQVVSTDLSILTWLQQVLGCGTIRPKTQRPKYDQWTEKRRDQWTFSVCLMSDVRYILELILPYLRVKKKQAELLLLYCKEHIPRASITEVEECIYNDLRKLNKRGK
jgi:hypothetical protein